MSSTFRHRTIAVTGGCGFIGSHLIHRLAGLGAKRIVAIDSLEYGRRQNLNPLPPQVEIVEHRLGAASHPAMRAALQGVDFLFHLAAEKHNQSIDSPLKVIDANIAGTHALLQAATECKVRKVVFTSSLYAYGRMDGPPFVETEIPRPQTVYGISKLAGEHLCWHFHRQFGLACVCLRFLFVYGPRQYANLGYKSVIVKSFQRLLAGEPPVINGDGRQVLDYVYVDDAVAATLLAMSSRVTFDVFNLASGNGIAVADLIQQIQRVAGTSFAPAFAPRDVTHGSSRVGSPEKMRSVLGFLPSTPLMTGLQHTYSWLKQSTPS